MRAEPYRGPLRQAQRDGISNNYGMPPDNSPAPGGPMQGQSSTWDKIKGTISGAANAIAPTAYHRGRYYKNKAMQEMAAQKGAGNPEMIRGVIDEQMNDPANTLASMGKSMPTGMDEFSEASPIANLSDSVDDNTDMLTFAPPPGQQEPSELRKWGIPFQGGLTPFQRLQMKQKQGGRR